MKLCVTSGILSVREDGGAVPFQETLAFLKSVGFEEVDYGFSVPELLANDWQTAFARKLDQAESALVRIRYAHLPFDYPGHGKGYDWADFFTASCRAMELAAAANVDCAAIHPHTKAVQDYDAQREHAAALAFLAPYREHAQKVGLTLALENMRGQGRGASNPRQRYCTQVEDVIRLAEELDMGICWDTGHANISAQAQSASLIQIGNRLKMVHINDNWAQGDIHIAPFLGNTDWRDVVKGLKAVNFTGSLNLEVKCNKLPQAARPAYAAYMAASAKVLIGFLEAAPQAQPD